MSAVCVSLHHKRSTTAGFLIWPVYPFTARDSLSNTKSSMNKQQRTAALSIAGNVLDEYIYVPRILFVSYEWYKG